MPTIGEEYYDETDRVPLRDVRGTPEQVSRLDMRVTIAREMLPSGQDIFP